MLNKKNKLLLFAFILVVTLNLVSPYVAPQYDDINMSLCSGYTIPSYDSINFTLGLDDSCGIIDTCTYGGTGNWNISLADFCVLEIDTNLSTNDLIFWGEGNATVNATIDAVNIKMQDSTSTVYVASKGRINLG